MRYDRVCGSHVKQSRSRLERLGGIPEPDADTHMAGRRRAGARGSGETSVLSAPVVRACPSDRTLELVVSRPVRPLPRPSRVFLASSEFPSLGWK